MKLSDDIQVYIMDEKLVVLYIKGTGNLCITEWRGTDEVNRVIVDIAINTNLSHLPILLPLSKEYIDQRIEIKQDKSIIVDKEGLRIEENELLKCYMTGYNHSNDLNKETIKEKDEENTSVACGCDKNGKEITDDVKETKAHRRNNSAFLQIHRRRELNVDTSVEDNSKVPVVTGNLCTEDRALEERYASTLKCSCDTESVLVDLKEPSLNETKQKITDTERLDIRTKDRRPTGKKVDQFAHTDKTDISERGHKLPMMSFSSTLTDAPVTSSLSLCESIRKSYTYLLDVLDIQDLCDHLYENYVLELGFYQHLFQMCFNPDQSRNAKRCLLMHLSTRTVKKEKLIDSLFGSAQYQLIPCFYPDIKI